ncbi:MAG: putative sporulation protein YtxC [Armatimonadetes bacterium]|nr:putative sporulation protein YtxC [Armatimonadota bacterium]
MQPWVAVGAINNAGLVKERLQRELRILAGEGIEVKLEESLTGKLTFFFCRLTDFARCPYKKEDVPVIFRQYIASALSDLILGSWEQLLLQQIIRENYYYFEPAEQEIIYRLALQYVNKGKNQGAESLCLLRRKNKILKRLLEFLRSQNQIVIEGFIRFRLKEYTRDLEEAVDRAVDDYLLEKEYREFVQLLQYFVEIQKPRLELVHVVLYPGGVFKLYNEQKQPITSDSLEEVFAHLVPGEINYEDLLFSVLVSLAPRQIVFHGRQSKEKPVLLKTIQSVFQNRVRECLGCSLCREEGG